MARYHVDNRMGAGSFQNMAATYKTMVSVQCSSAPILRRGRVVALAVGAEGAPNATDCQIVWAVQRITLNASSTTAISNPIVPADTASAMYAIVNHSSEGTYTLPIWERTLNQRASMQWVAQDTDAMLLWPATGTTTSNGNGVAAMALSPTYTGAGAGGGFSVDYEDL